ncbi:MULTISPECIES: hypothetical protein [Arthrobacter]|uniref:hypothetical protein n=1 Tax=Arthrobacter TaxID=1663 RepID=UPI001606E4B5|nr:MULTISPECIES: hypothetical protein [Arthrobacter]QYF89762.1 hypothetical protein KY499_17380 [Arthrobacter sp. PAMC25284]
MELLGTALIILILSTVAATIKSLRDDGRGHTPAVRSDDDWTALDLPSVTYLRRIL